MIQDHAGQSPILIGIPYPVVYEVPMRRRPRPYQGQGWRQIEEPTQKFVKEPVEITVFNAGKQGPTRQEVLQNQDDIVLVEDEPVFDGPAWMN